MFVRPKSSTIAILAILSLVLGAGAWYTHKTVVEHKEQASDAGQAFFGNSSNEDIEDRYTAVNGAPLRLHDYFGSYLYVNSWASWSPLSRDELLALDAVAAEYKDKNIKFIALNRKESQAQSERFLASLPPLLNLIIVVDNDDFFYGQAGGYAMPETLIYDTDGTLLRHERTVQTTDSIRSLIDEALAAE